MKTWVIGNWKKNPASLKDVEQLATAIGQQANALNKNDSSNIMIIPSALHIVPASQAVAASDVLIGCQDISAKSATVGAFTGDNSAQQMREAGVSWSLVGHSERRQYHRESGEVLIAKIKNTLEQGLGVIFCIGETLVAHDLGKTIPVLQEQLAVIKEFANSSDSVTSSLPNIVDYADKLIIAYEPVWAIGTGKVPTVAEVEAVHQEIRDYLIKVDDSLADVPIIYGGSVNPDNAGQFANSDKIQGALVGGASLDADKFLQIADSFFTIKS